MKVCIQHFCLPNKNVSHLLFLLSFSTSPNLVMSYRRTDVITQWHVLKQSKLMVNKCSVLFVKAYVSPLCKPSINRSVSSYWKMFSIITEICLMHYKHHIWIRTVQCNPLHPCFWTIELGINLKIQPLPIFKDFNTTIMATIADCSVSF